jgi:hypothetical protein
VFSAKRSLLKLASTPEQWWRRAHIQQCASGRIKKNWVTETNGKIKVKWEGGQTSYFLHGERGNIKLDPPGPRASRH